MRRRKRKKREKRERRKKREEDPGAACSGVGVANDNFDLTANRRIQGTSL